MATGLFASLPKPKYTGEHEEVPLHAQPKGPRIVGPGVIDESQIVLKVSVSSTDLGKCTDYSTSSAPVLLHTVSGQDGDLDRQRTSAMGVPFQKSPSHNIL
jgi:hypothetical protein